MTRIIEYMSLFCGGCPDLEVKVLDPWKIRGLNVLPVDVLDPRGRLKRSGLVYDLRVMCRVYGEPVATPTLRYDDPDGTKHPFFPPKEEKNAPPAVVRRDWLEWLKGVDKWIEKIMRYR